MKSASQIEEAAAQWLALRDRAPWSDDQQQEFERWLNESTAHRVAWLRLDSAWRRAERLGSVRVPGRMSVAPRVLLSGRFPAWRIAAGFVLVAALGALLQTTGLLEGGHTFSTAIGRSRTVMLADGSRVILNTDTHLHVHLDAHQRTIWLDKGEAYFEVVHNPNRPFVVNAGGSRIDDIGTKFSVRRERDRVDVVVLDGQVQVGTASQDPYIQPALASRNDTVIAAPDGIVVTPKTAEQVGDLLGWREGKLILNQMTLAQAAAEFNRYNHKQLLIDDPAAAQIRLGGRFNVNNVEGLARLLHEGFGLKVVEEGDIIRISS